MTQKYLSETFTQKKIEELFKKNSKIQIITAPTGAGKTYFIQKNVIKIAKGEFKPFGASEKKALLLANRSILVSQIRDELRMNLDKTEFNSFYEEIYVTKYVDILSYQALAKKILEDVNFLQKYKLIIADECHYFLNDAWNNTTQLTLNKLIEHSKDNTILFFSATTGELKFFMDAMKDIEYGGKVLYEEVLSEEESKYLGFNNRLDITVTNADLETVLERIPVNDKFIIFVNEFMSKVQIEEISQKLSKSRKGYIGFLYSKWEQAGKGFKSDHIMSKRYEEVLEKEGFYDDSLGLIANNAIDNGINFKMEDLKHIILWNQYDFTQIKQFIGRKRHNPNNLEDRTNVYIISHNKLELAKIKDKCYKTINYYKDYKNMFKEDFMEKYKDEITLHSIFVPSHENSYIEGLKIWNKTSYRLRRYSEFPFMITFNYKGDIEIYPNYCQIQKIQNKFKIVSGALQQLEYCTMAKFFKVNLEGYYNNIKILEVCRSKSQKKYSAQEEIPEYLDTLKCKNMNKDQYRKLREEFKSRWDIKHAKKFTILGDKAFNEYINQFGYGILKSKNKDRQNVYSITKL